MNDKQRIDRVLKALQEGTESVRSNPSFDNYEYALEKIEQAGRRTRFWNWNVRPWFGYTIGAALLLSGIYYGTPLKTLISSSFQEAAISPVNKPPPEQAIRDYYSAINNHQYQAAWNYLSSPFQSDQSLMPAGYSSYVGWWETVERVKINRVSLISKGTNSAVVDIHLQYLLRKNQELSPPESLRLGLLWESKTGKWVIETSKYLS